MTGTVDKAKEDVIHGREGYCLNVNFYSALNYYEKQVLFAQTSKGGDGRSQVEIRRGLQQSKVQCKGPVAGASLAGLHARGAESGRQSLVE